MTTATHNDQPLRTAVRRAIVVAGIVSRFRHTPHGSSPDGVDPRIVPWFWAFYDECAKPGDLDCRRYAARQLTLCLPSSLQDPPQFDEHGHIWPRPKTHADRLCEESAARDGGRLHNYSTGEYLRRATIAERYASRKAATLDGGIGAFDVEIDGEEVTCYVDE